MMQSSAKFCSVYKTSVFQQSFKSTLNGARRNERQVVNISISRKRSLHNMVSTSSFSLINGSNRRLPSIPPNSLHSPWEWPRDVSYGKMSRFFSSIASGNGNNNGDPPEDGPPGKSCKIFSFG